MPRARNLKPGFFTNDQLLGCEPLARLLFAGLWCLADREGRLEDRPVRIKIEILPCDNCDVDGLLSQLHDNGLIVRYERDGRRFLSIPKFLQHQKPHHKEKPSTIPPIKVGASTHLGTLTVAILNNETLENESCRGIEPSLNPSSLNPSSLNPESLSDVPNEDKNFDLTAEGLAQEFAFRYRGTSTKERDAYLISGAFGALLEQGVKAEDIRDRIKDPKRLKTQYLWEFMKVWGEQNREGQQARSGEPLGRSRVHADSGKYAGRAKVVRGEGETVQGSESAAPSPPSPDGPGHKPRSPPIYSRTCFRGIVMAAIPLRTGRDGKDVCCASSLGPCYRKHRIPHGIGFLPKTHRRSSGKVGVVA